MFNLNSIKRDWTITAESLDGLIFNRNYLDAFSTLTQDVLNNEIQRKGDMFQSPKWTNMLMRISFWFC